MVIIGKDTEYALIGKCFTDDVGAVLRQVKPHHFQDEKHSKIFQLIRQLFLEHGRVSYSVIRDDGRISKLMSDSDIELARLWAESEPLEVLVSKAREYFKRSQMHAKAEKIIKDLHNLEKSSDQIISDLTRTIQEISQESDLRIRNLDEIEQGIMQGDLGKRLRIGEPQLDEFYRDIGSHYGTTEVCIAQPKHGKTRYACMRANLYLNAGYKGLYITTEGLDSDIWHNMKQLEYKRGKDLYVAEVATELPDVCNLIWQEKVRRDIDFVVVDYIQRIRVPGIKNDDVLRIKETSEQLTNTIKRHKVFGLLMAQPKNLSDDRKGWGAAPNVDDIYGSGQIKKDAYLVTGLFRPSEVRGLLYRDSSGRYAVKDHMGTMTHPGSLFLRQLVRRVGKKDMSVLQMIDSNSGPKVQKPETYYDSHDWKIINN